MLGQSVRRKFWKPGKLSQTVRCLSTKFAYPEGRKGYEEDWTEEPEYPPIDPEVHKWNEWRRGRRQKELDWHQKIRNASCPEAKNLEYNMPRQFGWKVFRVTEDSFAYNSLEAYKFVTRTHIVSNSQLPANYNSPEVNERVEYFKRKVKGPLMEALKFELEIPRSYEKDFNEFSHTIDLKKSQSIVSQINRILLQILGKEVADLRDCQVDVKPNVQAFWQVGGQEPSLLRRNQRKGTEKIPVAAFRAKYVKADDPVEHSFHYTGSPLLQVRCRDPRMQYVDPLSPLCRRSVEEFPDRFPHFLQSFGFRSEEDYRFASIVPGHWSGDEAKCNLLAFHSRYHLVQSRRTESKYWSSKEENEEALFAQAMLVTFGRLVGQALYHGYDQYTGLEYPFSTQSIITNGLDWSFFAYQLNTLGLHQLAIAKNQKQNLLWGTQSQSIFKQGSDNELNEEVLGNLLKFYLNPPQPLSVENPTPYLGQPIQNWENDRERILTFFNFREQVSQRVYVTDSLRQFRPPEMYEYERIYKFHFDAIPLAPRRRWFALPNGFPGSKPWLDPYKLKNPLYESKGVRRLRDQLAAKKELERIEASKMADAAMYGSPLETSKPSRRR